MGVGIGSEEEGGKGEEEGRRKGGPGKLTLGAGPIQVKGEERTALAQRHIPGARAGESDEALGCAGACVWCGVVR